MVAQKVLSRIKQTSCIDKDGAQKFAVAFPDSLDYLPFSCGSLIRIDVVKVEFDLKTALKLEEAHRILAQKYAVSFEPEIFHGLKVCPSKDVTLAIYASGKAFMNVNAAKVTQDTQELLRQVNIAYTEVCGFLWSHLAEVINLSFCKPSK